jgi:DNA-binding NtrC family response regulator
LRNVIERALILETMVEIQPGSLPDFQLEARLYKGTPARLPALGSLDEMMADYEKELIASLLEQNHFNLAKTAERLKISRHALRYRMQRLNIAGGSDEEEESSASITKSSSS